MKILVINCGSSSIKYQLFDMDGPAVIAKGLVEKIGLSGSRIKHERQDGQKIIVESEIPDHQNGLEKVLQLLISKENGVISSFDEIDAIGHRVVHGGEKFNSSVLITDEVIAKVNECIDLAPLHNPPNLVGIYTMQKLLPKVPQVGVFDTAFHQTMPEYAYMYALPYDLYTEYGVRRYGFHGSSHRYVSQRAAEILGRDLSSLRIVTCHMGNGGSIAAVQYGRCVDTSMGLTPTEGLVMGTRVGDVDPGCLAFIMRRKNLDAAGISRLINKESGLLGISGVSSDMREVSEAARNGNKRARLSLEMFGYRVRKYIGSYAAAMGGLDVIVFTGGIGENVAPIRAAAVKGLEFMGVQLDTEKNATIRGKEAAVSLPGSKVTVLVVPTDEELVIAKDAAAIVSKLA